MTMAMLVAPRLVHLSAEDVVVICFYFVLVLGIGFYLRGRANTGEDFFMAGREMTAWVAGLSFLSANLGALELMGWAGFGLPVRHSGDALVLDRRHPGDAVPGAGHDAVLLHLQNPLRAGISETAFRRTGARLVRGFVRIHDRAHERREHVCHGQGHANCAGMGH